MTFNYLCVGKLSCCKPSDSSAITEGTGEPERNLHGRSTEGEKCVVSFLCFVFFSFFFFNFAPFLFPFLSFLLSPFFLFFCLSVVH